MHGSAITTRGISRKRHVVEAGVSLGDVHQGPAIDAVSALVNLGYRPLEAHRAVQTAIKSLGEAAELQALIRDGLRYLAP